MKGTFKDFKQFVAQQNPNREIKHGSWCECSVGDYARYVGDPISLWNDIGYAENLLPQDVNYDLDSKRWANENVPTYGELHKYLETVGV